MPVSTLSIREKGAVQSSEMLKDLLRKNQQNSESEIDTGVDCRFSFRNCSLKIGQLKFILDGDDLGVIKIKETQEPWDWD
ncbi:hypothetical protein ES332_D05G084800v1 [Gossypium tomentosum]|uniref:Uncharacterized protein n=1 Tax=Gossypium tomentosum TaxID=34277 RepID=A0A5D2KSU1_GOSTO|nr:hypothetical protein ES332_D05G084800v1 [Gossypium tomentosum]